MSPADLFRSSLEMKKPPGGSLLPLWELEFHGWQHFATEAVILGKDFAKLGGRKRMLALDRDVEMIAQVSEELDFSAITVPGGYWEIAPGHPAYYWLPPEERYNFITKLNRRLEGKRMLVAGTPAVLAMPEADRYLDFSYRILEQPEAILEEAEKLLEDGQKSCLELFDLGVEAFYTPSDIADNHGPYFDPEQMRSLILPQLDAWSRSVLDMGGLPILHSDGQLTTVLDQLADTAVLGLQAIDPTAGMDLEEAFRISKGRLALCGNLDCGLFHRENPEEIYRQAADLIKVCSQQPGWIIGASNAIEAEMKKENYEAFLRARKDHPFPRAKTLPRAKTQPQAKTQSRAKTQP